MKKLTLALLAAALLGTGVSFADNPPASGGAPATPAATSTSKKSSSKKHGKKTSKKGHKKDEPKAAKPAEPTK